MIRERMAQLDVAAERAIAWIREPQSLQDVAQPVLTALAQAAGSLWAAYWVIDAAQQRLRPFLTWSPPGNGAPLAGQDAPLLLLGFGNAAVVWCGRKPVWSTAVTPLSLNLPGTSAASGLHGAVWFAVKTDSCVYGVIELLGRASESKAPESLALLERLGFRLGLALEESLYRHRPAQSLSSPRGPRASS